MYIPPSLRCTLSHEITNLCDEYFHIDETPEASVPVFCINSSCCIRKSVTCIVYLTNRLGDFIYSKVYKNKHIDESYAVHAEMFMIYDNYLREKLQKNQTLTLYLTYQPCHFSGGKIKHSQLSCTKSIEQFYEKILQPLNISLVIKFAYIYRAHWMNAPFRFQNMIQNAVEGLHILKKCAKLEIIDKDDWPIIYHHCSEQVKKEWDEGKYDLLLQERKKLTLFIKSFLENIYKGDVCHICQQ